MPILQLTRMPVSVYKSTDDQAPQLAATPGSLKTILEACLVTGYGSKQGLGWEMPFSSATAAAFKSKMPDSTGCYLHIDNAGARYADIRGYRKMTALENGESRFGDDRYRRLSTLYYNRSNAPWMLVGHGKAFWLFIYNTYNENSSLPLFFGDFPSYAHADKGNCGIFNICASNNAEYLNNHTSPSWNVNNGTFGVFSAAASWSGLSNGASLRCNSRCIWFSGQQYPDMITGGLQADAIDLHEYIDSNNNPLRGRLPGAYFCAHNLGELKEFTFIDNFDGSDDRFVKVRLDGSAGAPRTNHYLINTTAWLG